MSDGPQDQIDVYQTRVFEKALNKLSDSDCAIVEDEIDKIIADPELGELKKGDLSYLRVHKFLLHKQQVLLGYSWVEDKLELYLLNIGSHENFYRDAKKRSKSDLKFITG